MPQLHQKTVRVLTAGDSGRSPPDCLRVRFNPVEVCRAKVGPVQPRRKMRAIPALDVDFQERLANGVDPVGERTPRLNVPGRPPLAHGILADRGHCIQPPKSIWKWCASRVSDASQALR